MPGKTKQGGGLEVASSYKMKNSALHMGAKHGTPIHANYGAPAKKALVGDQHNLPEDLKAKIEAAPGKYTGHYNDPRMAQGSGMENEILHRSGQPTVQAPIAMKESPNEPEKATDEVEETEYEMLKKQRKNKLEKVQTGPIAKKYSK